MKPKFKNQEDMEREQDMGPQNQAEVAIEYGKNQASVADEWHNYRNY